MCANTYPYIEVATVFLSHSCKDIFYSSCHGYTIWHHTHTHTCAQALWSKSSGVIVSTMSLSSIGLYVDTAHSVFLTFLLCSVILVWESRPSHRSLCPLCSTTYPPSPPPHLLQPICNPIPHHAPPTSALSHFSKTNQLSWAGVSLGAGTGVQGLRRVTHGSTRLLPFLTTCRYSRAAESVMDFIAGTLIAATDRTLSMANNKWEPMLTLWVLRMPDILLVRVVALQACWFSWWYRAPFRLLWLMSKICRCKTKIDSKESDLSHWSHSQDYF